MATSTSHESDIAATQVVAAESISRPLKNRFRLGCSCLLNFINGLNDAAHGALIPFIERYLKNKHRSLFGYSANRARDYSIGYTIVSLIFVGNAVGFIMGAAFLEPLTTKFGRARLLVVSQTTMTVAYIPILLRAPYPAVVFGFFLTGFAISINIALTNTFCSSLTDSVRALGAIPASYGLGGTIGPLLATIIASKGAQSWAWYYTLPFGLAIFSVVFSAWSFWRYAQERESENATNIDMPTLSSAEPRIQMPKSVAILKSRTVLLGASFIFAYQGAEVSIAGWVVSFLIDSRQADLDTIGFVSSGFWAGITVGRFLMFVFKSKVNERLFVYLATVGAVAFELLVWLIPNIIGPAISVAIVGLLLGPIYPCAISLFMQDLPRSQRVKSMGIISALGSSGGAFAPFSTGFLAQEKGSWTLHPMAIGLFCIMVGCWLGTTSIRKREE